MAASLLRAVLGVTRFWKRRAPIKPAVENKIRVHEISREQRLPFETAVEILRQSPDGGAGLLRVVALTDFRQAVGDKWPRLADKVGMIVDNLIRRRLGAGNLHQQVDVETWMLAFMRSTPDQARETAALIAQDISRHLLGDRCVAGERPLAAAAHLSPAQALDDRGKINLRAVRAATAEAQALFAHLSPCAPASIPMHHFDADNPVKRRHAQAAAWIPIVMDRKGTELEEPWQNVGPVPAEARLSLLWRPTWVAEGEAISAYCARISRIDYEGGPNLEGPMAYPADDAASAFTIDRFVAAAAMRDMRNAAHRSGMVIIPLTWSSLISENRAELTAPFADLPAALRESRVQVEICRIPDQCEPDQVNDVIDFVRSLCGGVLLRLRLSSSLLCRADELHHARIGLDLAELRPHERMNDDKLLHLLDLMQASAEPAGLGCYVWSARRRKLVGGVVTGGFDMVNGPGLMKDVGRPAVVMPAPRRRFLSD